MVVKGGTEMTLEVIHRGTATILATQLYQDMECILCLIPKSVSSPYVTWMRKIGVGHEHTFWGHYFQTLTEAYEDWKTRCQIERRPK